MGQVDKNFISVFAWFLATALLDKIFVDFFMFLRNFPLAQVKRN